jgi:aldehyde dehydrogenase (NAD+)
MDVLQQFNIHLVHPGACDGNGQWLAPAKGTLLHSINPTNEKPLASIQYAGSDEYEHVVKQAQQAFTTWRLVPAPKRAELIRYLAELLRKNKTELATLITIEMGKTLVEALGEVQEMIDMADFAIGQARMLYGKTMQSERPAHRMYEQWHPLGITGVISAFNFPVAVWSWNAMLAAICGNTVIWKPSHKVPLCAIAVQQLCNQAMQATGYHGVFSLFIGERSVSESLLRDKRIPLISFTGSSAVGQHVNQIVAERFGRALLECGGNNAVIVDATADLDLAVRAIVFGAAGTAGQRCTTTRRLFIHNNVYEKLTKALVHAYQQIRIGDPLLSENLVGPLVDLAAVQQFVATIAELQNLGANILTGGNVLAGPGYFVEPTIVTAQPDWPLLQNETFVPILYVMRYQDFDEVLAWHNDVPQGLSSALFTRDLQCAEKFLSVVGSDCGIANINIGTSGAEIGGAFGGEKETGGGREAGSDAWKAYMRRQTNTINWGNDLPLAQGIKFA